MDQNESGSEPRRIAVLRGAIAVLGSQGARALTHRAVDRAAAVAEGTTSNHFRTRTALLVGALEYISAADAKLVAPSEMPATIDDAIDMGAAAIAALLGPGKTLVMARHTLFLEAMSNVELHEQVLRASRHWWRLGSAVLAALGVPDAETRGRWLFGAIDGLILDQILRPDPDFDPHEVARGLLQGFANA